MSDTLRNRFDRAMPVRYFHLTFTIPAEFRRAVRSHQKVLEDALIRSAAEAIQTLAEDRLGGRVGILAALHTWGRAMPWHPHVHCLIPGVVVHKDGTFTVIRRRSLLPLVPLSRVFAGIFVRLFQTLVLLAEMIRVLRKPSEERPLVRCEVCGCASFTCKDFTGPHERAPP